MAKDYFQDIIPPDDRASSEGVLRPAGRMGEDSFPPQSFKPRGAPPSPQEDAPHDEARSIPIQTPPDDGGAPDEAPRGIRSISAPSRPRPQYRPSVVPAIERDFREGPPISGRIPPRRSSRLWMWAGASVVLLAIVAGLLLFFGSTTVTVTPKSRTAILNAATLMALEDASAPAGTLSYTMQIFDLEDSEVVAAQGTTRVESKASGSITVVNAYSATPLTFVKTTRFESPQGLIYRAASDVVVPGKKGSTPGTVSVTVVADQPGEKYNIGPTAKFTVPGLKTNSAMYAAVSAKSATAMQGGAAGDQPGAAPGALEAAVALVRGRLEVKAREAAAGQVKDDTFVFPSLITVTYESQPTTKEAGDSVRIHEKARVEVPAFPKDAFAQAVAKVAFTDIDNLPVTIEPQDDFSIRALTGGDATESGTLDLVASGKALIIWKVDTATLTAALAGKDSSAFQAIVNGFPSVFEANARISPFWKNTFPKEASDIEVKMISPKADE